MAEYQERDPAAPFTAKDCVVSISVDRYEEVVEIDVLEANGARHQWGIPLPDGRQNDYQPFHRLSYEPVGCGRCARCEEEQKASEYQQTGDQLAYLTRHLMTCPHCGSKRCPKAADHRNTCQKENDQ